MLKTPEEYGYVLKNNLCLFTKGPLSQWWGGFKGQNSKITIGHTQFFNIFDCKKDKVAKWLVERQNAVLGWGSELEFNCAEQFMMAGKAFLHNNPEILTQVMEETHPGNHKALGRSIPDWDEELYKKHRLKVVQIGSYLKFSQNEELKDWLLSNFHPHTTFVEAAPWDKIWGIGLAADDPKAWDINTWEGLNLLGESLGYAMKRISKDWER